MQLVAHFLCIGNPVGDTLPSPFWFPDGWPVGTYHTELCNDSSLLPPLSPPIRLRRTCPPCWTLPTRRPPLGPRGDLVILASISLALRMPNVFLRTMWMKTRDISEFQLLPSTPCHSAANISMKRRLTALDGVAYQLAD